MQEPEKLSYWNKIKSGQVIACPACNSKLIEEPLYPGATATIFQCSSDLCAWNDESADLAAMGMFTPPAGWKVSPR